MSGFRGVIQNIRGALDLSDLLDADIDGTINDRDKEKLKSFYDYEDGLIPGKKEDWFVKLDQKLVKESDEIYRDSSGH